MREDQDAARLATLCAELARLLEQRTGADGGHETTIPQLTLWRFSNPTEPAHVLQQPAVYVVVQGRKHVTVGDETYVYDPSQYLAVSLEVPAVGHVVEASPDAPYLCITLRVDARELAALIVETGRPAPRDTHDGRAVFVSSLRAPLLDALLRLVRLLDAPQDIPVLAPLILRELHFRLLLSGATSAEAVAYEVGYASASQFSREYGRLFGQPPRRDAERMREPSPVRR